MARAAVKAKQVQQAKAQAAANASRKQRKHASGGNPNQDLFFSRLRRKHKWVLAGLALVFMISFVLLGVGSGSGGGLEQSVSNAISGWFGGGGNDAVSKAQAEIKDGKTADARAHGYLDLATAYTAQGNTTLAISSLETYLGLKKKDSVAWTQLALLKKQQASKYYQDYQQVQQANQLEAPGTGLQPAGTLGAKLVTNPIDEYYIQQNNALLTPLYKQVTTGFTDSLTAYKQAAKFAKTNDEKVTAWFNVANAASYAGQPKAELNAWRQYLRYAPNAPDRKRIEALCKHSLGGSCAPKLKKK